MAATTTDDTSVFTIKLVVDTRYRRVLFAKITTDVVDFLHALLISPDTPVSLDDMACWAGCTDNIVASVEELDYLGHDDILGLAIMKGASAAAFQEETVRLGRKEGLKILKASLKSKTVLTEVFLRDEAPAAGAPI
ncbi:unnamed protein product [Urochloa decumbens]|uniref:Uncharacterized protein n=1 Tax=Urochloa decumbens TaxID=240449 RepID=A0ABC9AIQ3_9POAL